MFNEAGLVDIFDIDRVSLHSSNPGIGVNPAAGELGDAPYERQVVSFAAKVTGTDAEGPFARAFLATDVSFSLATGAEAQNVQFVGLWKGTTYKGYKVPTTPKNFNDPDSTSRTFILDAETFYIEQRNLP